MIFLSANAATFWSVSDHFGTLSIKELILLLMKNVKSNCERYIMKTVEHNFKNNLT